MLIIRSVKRLLDTCFTAWRAGETQPIPPCGRGDILDRASACLKGRTRLLQGPRGRCDRRPKATCGSQGATQRTHAGGLRLVISGVYAVRPRNRWHTEHRCRGRVQTLECAGVPGCCEASTLRHTNRSRTSGVPVELRGCTSGKETGRLNLWEDWRDQQRHRALLARSSSVYHTELFT